MTVKISDLIGRRLDAAVARAEGLNVLTGPDEAGEILVSEGFSCQQCYPCPAFSTDPRLAYTIIEREDISVVLLDDHSGQKIWAAQKSDPWGARRRANLSVFSCVGSTIFIAAMRCYITSVDLTTKVKNETI